MKKFGFLVVVSAMVVSSSAMAGQCDEERTISKEFDMGALVDIRVQAGAGGLSIKGSDQKGKIGLVAKLCASDERVLAKMDVKTGIDGKYVSIKTGIPKNWRGNHSATIDLALTVPSDVALDVVDSSGDIDIKGIARLLLMDTSGDILIKNVEGSVKLTDSSGAVRMRKVGSAEVTDSSGGIYVKDVLNDFTIDVDSSGDIDVRGVGGDLLIRVDSSGSINVKDILGDFTVEKDGSGGIRFEDVKGEVSIPRKKM